MRKEVILLKAPWCPVCPRADALYQKILSDNKAIFDYRPLNVEEGAGLALAKKKNIYAISATLIDGQVVFKGKVPSEAEFLAALK